MTESLLCDQQGTDDDRHLLQGFGDSAGNFDLLVKLSTKKTAASIVTPCHSATSEFLSSTLARSTNWL